MFYFWIYHLISQLHICIDTIFIELFYNHFQVKQNITVIIHCFAVHVQNKLEVQPSCEICTAWQTLSQYVLTLNNDTGNSSPHLHAHCQTQSKPVVTVLLCGGLFEYLQVYISLDLLTLSFGDSQNKFYDPQETTN